jgi:hypothetical protein
MRKGTIALIAALLALLGAAGWFAYQGLIVPGAPMPPDGYIALAIGVILSIIVGTRLIALLFFSAAGTMRRPHLRKRNEPHPSPATLLLPTQCRSQSLIGT